MAEDHVLTEEELQNALGELSDWELRDGWLRRTFTCLTVVSRRIPTTNGSADDLMTQRA